MSRIKTNEITDVSGLGSPDFPNGFTVGYTPARVRAYLSGNQTVSATTEEIVEFDTESFDAGGDFDTSTHRFTAPRDGKYRIYFQYQITLNDGELVNVSIKDDGGTLRSFVRAHASANSSPAFSISDTIELSAGDWLDFRCYNGAASGRNITGDSFASYVTIEELVF